MKEQTENIEIKTSGETVKEGEPFKCELAPATGYKFPYVIKVMMGGRLLKQKNLLRAAGSEYYTYDNTTGIIEIENVDGEIVIEAKGVQEGFFEVIPNLVNLTSEPASFEPLAKDSKVELTLKAASGYASDIHYCEDGREYASVYGLYIQFWHGCFRIGEDHGYLGDYGGR